MFLIIRDLFNPDKLGKESITAGGEGGRGLKERKGRQQGEKENNQNNIPSLSEAKGILLWSF